MASALSSRAHLVGVSAVARRSAAAIGVAETCAEVGAGSLTHTAETARPAASVSVSSPVLRAASVPYVTRSAATLSKEQITHYRFRRTFAG